MIPKEHLYDNAKTTSNSGQIELLKKHFPSCFDKNGAFIPHKMSEVVGQSALELSKESYSLNWLGKSYARLLANETPFTLLREDKKHNQKEANQNSENLLIKGDNLEVLKHLKNAYSESIKMIYIDPPYNTGGDGFVYNDDRKFTPEQLMRLAGIELDEAKRILEFTRSKANSHSAWLTFMYPRLYIARELLKDDGVIFISIDDNEQAQLKLLCDEVFGEENFVESLIWKRRATPPNDRVIGRNHEYILVYAKNIYNIFLSLQPRGEKLNSRFSNPNNDEKGAWVASDLSANGKGGRITESCIFEIVNPQTGEKYLPPKNKCWLYNEEKIKSLILEGRISFRERTGTPFLKRYLNEVREGSTLATILENYGFSQDSAKEIKELFDNDVFDFPKPLKLLKTLILSGLTTSNDLILDFFAGSGTTAHAVMDLNAQDNGNRKFICVQLPELTDPKSEAHKAGYTTIFDITKARIEKASEKIKKETSLLHQNMDLGFKIFETMPLFEGYLDDMEELSKEQTLFDGTLLNDEALEALLVTWKVYDGQSLTTPLQRVSLSAYAAYLGGKNLYLMHKGFDMEALKAFIAKLDSDKDFNPSKIVLFGYNFESKTQRELKEAMSVYTNKKAIELDIVVRY
ncbi:MAG: site-specific DNA-methyltransferase [Sulfurospirillaceae bacterium]|nr:site-specific DNA-methyltransferase [Sulfurospirillaceae bacterium]